MMSIGTIQKCYETISVTSLSDFLKEASERQILRENERKQDSGSKFQADAWFRGVADTEYVLRPSYHRFHRSYEDINEDDLRGEFTRRALPLLEPRDPADEWEWYFLMQHYGLPTRLLDWSEISLVGLFFAAYDYGKLIGGRILSRRDGIERDYCQLRYESETHETFRCPRNASVWMMDPITLNRHSRNDDNGDLLRNDGPRLSRYLSSRPFESIEWPGKPEDRQWADEPIAIMPSYTNRRLVAQRGMFVLFGESDTPLEQLNIWKENPSKSSRLIKFEISADSIPQIRAELRWAGITPALLFPELPMLCHDILQAWCHKASGGWKFPPNRVILPSRILRLLVGPSRSGQGPFDGHLH